ncbi:uncharacterized protein G2W53_007949 [Senna tora]|uniref:DOMON domain-containing protein n=1 Tax=Senna tora TaxID=362788 RepID=A0A834X7E1_9FABA|nr:uncharacterized protein G2W53_007949 [Senna tora]
MAFYAQPPQGRWRTLGFSREKKMKNDGM